MPTVLIVEDDLPLLAALTAALSAHGFETREAGDVAGALAHLAAASIDVVLSDIGMPGNGYNLLAKVREMRPAIPVILMTGIDEGDLGQRAYEAGACAYLIKPLQLSVLKRTIEEACRCS
jgi:DNA-binding NtrC family response regulator